MTSMHAVDDDDDDDDIGIKYNNIIPGKNFLNKYTSEWYVDVLLLAVRLGEGIIIIYWCNTYIFTCIG